jgi:hypothetical protein
MIGSGTPSVDRGKQLPMRDSIPSKPRVFNGDPKIFSWEKTRVLVVFRKDRSMSIRLNAQRSERHTRLKHNDCYRSVNMPVNIPSQLRCLMRALSHARVLRRMTTN